MQRKKGFEFSTTQLITLSFLAVILVGSLLLSLPFASASGEAIPYIDALFTATTATCVTGLVTVTTVSAFTTFGHIVILLLIQIGGLGLITIMSFVTVLLQKKIALSDRVLLQDAFNLNSMEGLVRFLKRVVKGTLIVEGLGALSYMTVFVRDFGARGIWISVFNSVSAFCNAGIDILAEDSLCGYAHNPVVNITTELLIILGGLGYIVWWDIIRVLRERKRFGGRILSRLTLHSKIAVTATVILIFGGAALIMLFEYNNPLTMADKSFFEKLELSLFQSVTTRTAGFMTMPQQDLTNGSGIVSMLLMFIGGSPVGTAGGIKTVTAAVLVAAVISVIKERQQTVLFGRAVSQDAVKKALAVTGIYFVILTVMTLALSLVCSASILDLMFETVSAIATVGLSRNLTSTLSDIGKLIITLTMYIGRVGPISLAVAFNLKKRSENKIKNPTEEISVG